MKDWRKFDPKAISVPSEKNSPVIKEKTCNGGSCIGGNCKAMPDVITSILK